MSRRPSAETLHGRHNEIAALERLLTDVRAGRSQVLVLHGDAGVGKTALLDHLVLRAKGCRIIRAAGVESEMELAFAGLHQVCTPLVDRLESLPDPQHDALGTAFGLRHGKAADRFLVGLAVLTLLSRLAEQRPLICVVDDAQWLDRASAQTLAFVARRLLADAVGIVFAVRERDDDGLDGLPGLAVDGLGDADARALLDFVVTGPLDDRLRDRIVAETRGNPLALMEFARGLSPATLAGGFGLPDIMPITGRLEQSFLARLGVLPTESRRLLLTAAAEPTGDVALLWRAAERLGIPTDAAGPAEAAGLIKISTRVRFQHPLVRSAAARSADDGDLREVHRALAAGTDPDLEPDRRAWHRARAATGPDETVARDLERSAGRAQVRGGVAATAGFLERATELTPDPVRRGVRALAAAQAKFEAAAPGAALELLATAEMCPLDALQRARVERFRAQLTFAHRRNMSAPSLSSLLGAARRLESLDAQLARATYLDALRAGIFAGKLLGAGELYEAAESARTAPHRPDRPRAIDLLLDGLAVRFTDGYAPAVQPLCRALEAFLLERPHDTDDARGIWLAWPVAYDLWDDEIWHALSVRLVDFAREVGALTVLPIALVYRAQLHVQAGQLAAASALLDEVDVINEAISSTPLVYNSTRSSARLVIASWQGREAQALELIEDSIQEAAGRGEGRAISLAELARAVLYNGLGRYDLALAAARRVCEHDDLALLGWGLVELVEASAHGGQSAEAEAALGGWCLSRGGHLVGARCAGGSVGDAGPC